RQLGPRSAACCGACGGAAATSRSASDLCREQRRAQEPLRNLAHACHPTAPPRELPAGTGLRSAAISWFPRRRRLTRSRAPFAADWPLPTTLSGSTGSAGPEGGDAAHVIGTERRCHSVAIHQGNSG